MSSDTSDDPVITNLSAIALSSAIRTREVSCREVMSAYLDRIDVVNPRYNAIVARADRDRLMAEAAQKDDELIAAHANGTATGFLHGMPQAIKDLDDAQGFPTTLGSPHLRGAIASADSLMVSRMKAAGCIIIGKTNTPEFGLGSHTFNDVYGTTGNAYNPSKTAGGSSGGAAVSLATHMLPVADGGDYMGSLRNPAGWNNVFGFRPSQGRVPNWPVGDVWVSQLSTNGPMARSVADLAQLLHIQAGDDPRLALSLNDGQRFDGSLDGLLEETQTTHRRPVRIGWLGDLRGHLQYEAGIGDLCEAALRRLEAHGCAIEPTMFDYSPEKVWDAWLTIRWWLAGSRVKPFVDTPERRALVKPEAQWEYDSGRTLTGDVLLQASARRTAFFLSLVELFERFDFLALPTAQVWPFDASTRWPTEINGVAMDTYHRWMEVVLYATFAGLPCMSVPVGFSPTGLPMGMQIIGRPRADLGVLRLSHVYEQLIPDILSVRPTNITDS